MFGFVLILLAVFLLGLMNKVLDTHTKSEVINEIIRLESIIEKYHVKHKKISNYRKKRINKKLHLLYIRLCSINEIENITIEQYGLIYKENFDEYEKK